MMSSSSTTTITTSHPFDYISSMLLSYRKKMLMMKDSENEFYPYTSHQGNSKFRIVGGMCRITGVNSIIVKIQVMEELEKTFETRMLFNLDEWDEFVSCLQKLCGDGVDSVVDNISIVKLSWYEINVSNKMFHIKSVADECAVAKELCLDLETLKNIKNSSLFIQNQLYFIM